MKTIAFVGVGNIAQVMADAIERLKVLKIVGGYGIAGKPEWWDQRPWYSTLERLADKRPDFIVVSTPSPTHIMVIRQIWAINSKQHILVEKPLATKLDDAQGIFNEAKPGTLSIFYHAAYAPEVVWAEQQLPDWLRIHGEVERYICFFSDPYASEKTDEASRSVYGSSWVDSGINCLSILKRLNLVDKVTDLRWDKERPKTAIAHTTFDTSKVGTIITQWAVTAPSKSTMLYFSDGTVATVDHQATAGRVITASGQVEALFGLTGDIPRLVRHYINLMQQEVVEEKSIFTLADHVALHTMLLGVVE
jgi:predicted dehydrogenase